APEPVPERPAAARPSLPLRLAGTAERTARTGRSLPYLAAASVAGLVVLATLAVWATGSPLIGAGAWWTDTGAEPAEHEVIGLVRVEQRGGSGERQLRPPLAGARPLAAAERRSEPLPIDPPAGEPSRTALERAPAPRQLLDPRGARALIDHASGELQLIRDWADPSGDRRAALFDVHVGANGRVRDVHVRQSSGSDEFDRRATEAVYGTVYHPARRGDVEVARWLRQRVASRAE
ncbi:MAG: energy transducer TonB, partial [Gemmatimonadota bacterium]